MSRIGRVLSDEGQQDACLSFSLPPHLFRYALHVSRTMMLLVVFRRLRVVEH